MLSFRFSKKNALLILSFFVPLSLNAQDSDWRNQFVKWNLESKYNLGSYLAKNKNESLKNFERFSFIISVDVALNENDVFDSSSLYLQPYFEVGLPFNSIEKNIVYTNYSAGVHLKKFFNTGNQKFNLYFLIGSKLEILKSRIKFLKYGEEHSYKELKNDFLIDAGIGYTFTDRFEFYFLYTRGLNKIYLQDDYFTKTGVQTFSFGLRLGLNRNWWFTGK